MKKKKKSLLAKIRDFFDKLLGRRIIKEEYTIRAYPEIVEKTEKALRRENAELWAKIIKQEEEIKKLRKIINTLKNEFETEIIEEAKLHEKVIRKVRAQNRVSFLFKKSKKLPVIVSVVRHKYFRDANGNPYKYWRGIEFESTRRGTIINLLVSRTPNDKVVGRIQGPPIQFFPYLFTDIYGLVQDLKTGFLVVNIAPDGTFIPPAIPSGEEEPDGHVSKENGQEKKTGNEKLDRAAYIDIAHLIQTKDPEVIHAILSLYKRLCKAESEKLDAMRRERDALMESIEAKVESESYKKAVDRATAFVNKFFRELDTAYRKLEDTKAKELTSRLKSTLTEMVDQTMWKVISDILSKRVPKISKEERDIIREEIRKDVDLVAKRISELMYEQMTKEKGGGEAG